VLTLVVVAVALRLPRRPATASPTRASVDVLGAVLLAAGVTCLLLVTVWGGTTYPWGSSRIVGTGVAGVVLLGLFLLREAHAAEPVLPLRLFRDPVFRICAGLAVLTGLMLFGAVVYLPEYQQVVKGESATMSGLLLMPLTAGIIVGAVGSGRLVSSVGRYRIFPIVGSLLVIVGFWLLTSVQVTTSQLGLAGRTTVLGLGVGLSLQVIVIAAQNAAPPRDLGTVTSSITFFRTLGGSLGTAILGAVLNARLTAELPRLLPAGTRHVDVTHLVSAPAVLRAQPAPVVVATLEAFVRAFHAVFLVALPFGVACLVLALVLPERPFHDVTAPATAARVSDAASEPETLALAGVLLAVLADRVEHDPAGYPRLARAVAALTPHDKIKPPHDAAWDGLTLRARHAATTVLRPVALRTLIRVVLPAAYPDGQEAL
jgi:MFS family permease